MISFFIKELFWPGAFDRFDQFKFLPRPASRSEDSRGSRQLLDWSSLTQFGERNSDKFPCILQSLLKMSEALSKEKNIYYSTLQNISLISKNSHPFKSTYILCKLFKAIISLRRSRNSRAAFEFQPPEPSNIIFYSMP